MVFRGVKGLLVGYVAGKTCCWVQFSSTASSVEVQNEFLGQEGQRTLFSIELTTGRAREISQYSFYPQEQEVLLPANTMLKVVAVLNMGHELSNVQLREVNPSTLYSCLRSRVVSCHCCRRHLRLPLLRPQAPAPPLPFLPQVTHQTHPILLNHWHSFAHPLRTTQQQPVRSHSQSCCVLCA